MWLWILSAFFLILVWTAWWFLAPEAGSPEPELFPLWVAITITAVVVLGLLTLVLYRRFRAARAARALEKAIAQQAQEQVERTKPEDRPEVQELQRQMLDGIRQLKTSRLGEGGGNALYRLPWYAIVGPPASGKTTALRYSGLSFPYLSSDGAGVRGVGGTRNCDWWFTNEAILLDTAGRYTTEDDDREEWLAFLRMLRSYRAHKPLNGVVVAVAIADLLDGTEEEVQRIAERVRDRIDEMQEELRMVLPVYVLFTKCDLVSGFVEFFGDLKRSERGQAWGATIPLSQNKDKPGTLFEDEFDTLVSQLHKRAIRRANSERPTRRQKEKIFQFPLEFAALKQHLAEFLAGAFAPAPPPADKKATHIPTPILRGFYFSSGTQEGRPLDRVVGRMARQFGLDAVDTAPDEGDKDSKSYFLKDVFQRIIFPDKDIAGRTEGELRRGMIQKLIVAACAIGVSLLLTIPAIYSFLNNRTLVEKTGEIGDRVGTINWQDKEDPLGKIDRLDELREHLEELDQWNDEGPPISYRFGMYQGETLFEPALEQYLHALRQGFVLPVRDKLEKEMRSTVQDRKIDGFLTEYNRLKVYLLMGPTTLTEHPDYEVWATDRLTREWAELLRANNQASEADLRGKVVPHVSYYVSLLRRQKLPKREEDKLDDQLIQSMRDLLSQVDSAQRFYDQFVTVLIDEKVDPTGADTIENRKYPPIRLDRLFADRAEVLTKLSSRRYRDEQKWQEVQGPYTSVGRKAVLDSLVNGYERLEREKWVVPVTREEKQQGDKIKVALQRVRLDYDQRYIKEWKDFFLDIDVAIPANNPDAIDEFRVLVTPDWPYWRLLRELRDNTQFPEEKEEDEKKKSGGVLDQVKRRVGRKVDAKLRTPGAARLLQSLGVSSKAYEDPIPREFKSMVDFSFPQPAKEGEGPPPSGLSQYVSNLEQLTAEMTVIEEGPRSLDSAKATELFEKAVTDAEKMTLTLDSTGQELMRPLLMNPLRQSYKAMVRSAGGAASGLWEVTVWPAYKDGIKNRYPFNTAAKRDASFEDAVAFFKPKEGILWGFYEGYLKSYHIKQGHKFVPMPSLRGRNKAGKPFTPFSANMYNCLERADEISDALFSQGDPGVKFKINLTTVSPIVSDIIFELDGQKRIYRNEKEFWHTFQWPGPEQPLVGATLRIQGAGGLDEEIKREGPWGMWRLIESGRHTATQDSDKLFIVEWQMAAPPVTVRMQIKPTRSNHPFPRNFFRDTNCPTTIGDTFGPG